MVKCVGSCEEGQIWQRHLYSGDLVVGFFNLKDSASRDLCISWDELDLEADGVYQVRLCKTVYIDTKLASCVHGNVLV